MPVDPRLLDSPFGHIVTFVIPAVLNLGHIAAVVALCLTLFFTVRGRQLPAGRERDRATWYRRRATEAALFLSGVAILLDAMIVGSVGWSGGSNIVFLPLAVPIVVLVCVTIIVLFRQFGRSLGVPDWISRAQ